MLIYFSDVVCVFRKTYFCYFSRYDVLLLVYSFTFNFISMVLTLVSRPAGLVTVWLPMFMSSISTLPGKNLFLTISTVSTALLIALPLAFTTISFTPWCINVNTAIT